MKRKSTNRERRAAKKARPSLIPNIPTGTGKRPDPGFLTFHELINTAIEHGVLVRRVRKYGTSDEGDVLELDRADGSVYHAILNEIGSHIGYEAQSRFEDWERRRGTFGKVPRRETDASEEHVAAERKGAGKERSNG